MSTSLRVAGVDELPPGKGKIVDVAGRQFTVFNVDGRFFATATPATMRHAAPPPADTSATCTPHGLPFDVWMEDSPARLRDEDRCRLRVDDDAIYLIVD
jgi:nitrite reductase/ring-hydroxylating ferredoxin subunit